MIAQINPDFLVHDVKRDLHCGRASRGETVRLRATRINPRMPLWTLTPLSLAILSHETEFTQLRG